MTTHRLGERGHEHKDMKPVLTHYGATYVPQPVGQHWVAMRCPFHDDHSASAQTDGVGFRCFTCSLFFPAPLALIKEQEGADWQRAHDIFHDIAGTGSVAIPGADALGFELPGRARNRATSRRSRQAGRRHRA